jgi:hypothetical protein
MRKYIYLLTQIEWFFFGNGKLISRSKTGKTLLLDLDHPKWHDPKIIRFLNHFSPMLGIDECSILK